MLRRNGGPATWLSAADSASGSSGSVERSGSARARRSRSPRQRDGGRRHGLLGAVGKRAGRRGGGTARGALLGPTPPRWAVGVEWALGRRRRRLDRPACACGESVFGLEADYPEPAVGAQPGGADRSGGFAARRRATEPFSGAGGWTEMDGLDCCNPRPGHERARGAKLDLRPYRRLGAWG